MTDSFQSTAFESSRRPVDTFVSPVRVQPKTNLMALAETMAQINPTLQKFVSFQIEKEKQKGILEGQNKILESTPEDINKIKKQLEEKEGKRFARNFIGGNIYTQYGIEKQLAINLGNASEIKTKKFFDEYVVDVELPSGQIVKQPLSQFDVGSPQFNQAVNEFQQSNLVNVKGIRPEILNKHFLPKQNLAYQKAFNRHQEARSNAKIELATTSFANSILSSWNNIDNINDSIELNYIDDNYSEQDFNLTGLSQAESIALEEIQENADYMVSIGLSESVSPASFENYIQNSVNTIIQSYKDSDMSETEALQEVDDFIDFIGKLKVGPKNTNKKNQVIQKDLKSFLDANNSIINIKKEVYKELNEFKKQELEFAENVKQNDITKRLDQLDFSSDDEKVILNNAKIISALKKEYKGELDFIDTEVTLKNFNVDGWFLGFQKRWIDGEFDGNKLAARTELTNFMVSLGSSATKEDRTEAKRLDTLVKSQSGQGLLTQYPEIKGVIKFGEKVLSTKNQFGLDTMSGPKVEQKYDLDFKFKQDLELVIVDSELTNKEKKDKIDDLIKGYKEQIGKIKNNTYTFFDEDNNISGQQPINTPNNSGSGSNNNQLEGMNLGSIPQFENRRGAGFGGGMPIELASARTTDETLNSDLLETYTVVSGDTIEDIAKKYVGVSSQDIFDYNNLKTQQQQDNLQIGQKIKIPKIEFQTSDGEVTPVIEEKTSLWSQFDGAKQYRSGDSRDDLDKDKIVIELDSHTYGDGSSQRVQDEMKKVYSKLFYSNDTEDIKIKNAIVNTVLTEAVLKDETDIAGVVQSIFARIVTARLNDGTQGRVFDREIIDELMRQEVNDKGQLVPMYEGLIDPKTKKMRPREVITSNKPIKESQEIFDKIFSMLWEDTSKKDKE